MGASVETGVESPPLRESGQRALLRLRLLGPMAILRDGVPLPPPASRKVRALIAYLALTPHAVARGQLCDLLWDGPDDPRAELRWCLSKIRRLMGPDGARLETNGDTVRLDLTSCTVDALEVAGAIDQGLASLSPDRLRALAAAYAGEFLDGLELERSPTFSQWLTAQRRRFRSFHIALLEQLAERAPDEDSLGYREKWLELAPFDRRAHALFLEALARCGKLREAEAHLSTATRMFDAEGLDCAVLREAWRSARAAGDGPAATAPAEPAAQPEASPCPPSETARRASIAVMPFVDQSAAGPARGVAADALAYDVIARLAKLRSLFVIAQGTVFALRDRHLGHEDVGRVLNVDYVVSGAVRHLGARLEVRVQLTETRTARVVWAEGYSHKWDDTFLVLEEIGNRIVAAIAGEIETIERNRAILRPPSSLDAWEAHHRGLWHMYRFSRAENERARHFFERAVQLDPTFARAYAGLSFTHFQNAFQGWAPREAEIDLAFEAAGHSLMADDRDPAAHWAMGRALWLRGAHGESFAELDQAVELSPNFAQGHYTLAFVHSQAGDASAAIASSDHSRLLSPFDPMLFAMLGARAMALARLERFEEAAEFAVKGAGRPNAHAHVRAIACFCLTLAGRLDEARTQLEAIRETIPDYRIENFLSAMRFTPDGERLFREAAKRVGIG